MIRRKDADEGSEMFALKSIYFAVVFGDQFLCLTLSHLSCLLAHSTIVLCCRTSKHAWIHCETRSVCFCVCICRCLTKTNNFWYSTNIFGSSFLYLRPKNVCKARALLRTLCGFHCTGSTPIFTCRTQFEMSFCTRGITILIVIIYDWSPRWKIDSPFDPAVPLVQNRKSWKKNATFQNMFDQD